MIATAHAATVATIRIPDQLVHHYVVRWTRQNPETGRVCTPPSSSWHTNLVDYCLINGDLFLLRKGVLISILASKVGIQARGVLLKHSFQDDVIIYYSGLVVFFWLGLENGYLRLGLNWLSVALGTALERKKSDLSSNFNGKYILSNESRIAYGPRD